MACPVPFQPLDERRFFNLLIEDTLATTQSVVHVVHAAFYEDSIRPLHSLWLANKSYHNSGIT